MSLTLEAAKDTDIAQIFLMDLAHVRTVGNTERSIVGDGSVVCPRQGKARRTALMQVTRGLVGVRLSDVTNPIPQRNRILIRPQERVTEIIPALSHPPLFLRALSSLS